MISVYDSLTEDVGGGHNGAEMVSIINEGVREKPHDRQRQDTGTLVK